MSVSERKKEKKERKKRVKKENKSKDVDDDDAQDPKEEESKTRPYLTCSDCGYRNYFEHSDPIKCKSCSYR